MGGEVLDEGAGGLDDVRIEPEDPGGAGAEGREEEGVAGAAHGLAANFLRRHLVPLFLVLRLQRRVKVLAEDADAREAVLDGAGLRLADGRFEGSDGGVAFGGVRRDEAQRDELVRVVEADEVVPEGLVEAG